MFDHPATQKVLVAVTSAGIVAFGGLTWKNDRMLSRHDDKLVTIEKTQDETIRELKSELKTLNRDVATIKEGVAVLRERTEDKDVRSTRPTGP